MTNTLNKIKQYPYLQFNSLQFNFNLNHKQQTSNINSFNQLALTSERKHRKQKSLKLSQIRDRKSQMRDRKSESPYSKINVEKTQNRPMKNDEKNNFRFEKVSQIQTKSSLISSKIHLKNQKISPIIKNKTSDIKFSIGNFVIEYVVGKGGFGKVWKVKQKKTSLIYAMKQMHKTKIISKKSVDSVLNQRKLLTRLYHPFIVNIRCSFQNRQNLYLIIDYLNGGDLRYHIGIKRKFTQLQSKFMIACIILALQYLHSNNVIHRDLKPQNLVFDNYGYLRLTDFGVSKQYVINNSEDTSGTPGYMSPEVICKRNHSFTADYFALGIIAYQLMLGKRPYIGKNRKQIRQAIISKQAKIQETPIGWSHQAVNFVNSLIQRRPQSRLGFNGISQIKDHPWLVDFDWVKLYNKKLRSYYIPKTIEQDYDNYKQCISEDSGNWDEQQVKLILRHSEAQELFNGYEYDMSNKKKGLKKIGLQEESDKFERYYRISKY